MSAAVPHHYLQHNHPHADTLYDPTDMPPLSGEMWEIIRREVENTIERNPWVKIRPTPKQMVFLGLPVRESLFGGAAGPGKSVSLLAHAAKYVDYPHYNALILRRTYQDLARPEALMDVAHQWWGPTAAKWRPGTATWRFPSGATISFGYMQSEKDKYNYYGSQYHCICWDELTQFTEGQYRFLFSRNRKTLDDPIPLTVRSASNPPLGGLGDIGWWVKDVLYDQGFPVFVAARLSDNPYIDYDSYVSSLNYLDPITREKLLNGDWTIRAAGTLLRPEWFEIVDGLPRQGIIAWARGWDLAGSTPTPANPDPDYTAGGLVALHRDGTYYIVDMQRGHWDVGDGEKILTQMARVDTPRTEILIEQEGGASGLVVIQHYIKRLAGYAVYGVKPSGSKAKRATPFAIQAKAGNVKLVRGTWNRAFLTEAETFPLVGSGLHDDQIDAVSIAFNRLALSQRAQPAGNQWQQAFSDRGVDAFRRSPR